MKIFNLDLKFEINKINFMNVVAPISLRSSLIYDAVMVFATAIQLLGREHVTPTQISCENPRSIWNKGYTILNFMKTVSIQLDY